MQMRGVPRPRRYCLLVVPVQRPARHRARGGVTAASGVDGIILRGQCDCVRPGDIATCGCERERGGVTAAPRSKVSPRSSVGNKGGGKGSVYDRRESSSFAATALCELACARRCSERLVIFLATRRLYEEKADRPSIGRTLLFRARGSEIYARARCLRTISIENVLCLGRARKR